MADKITNIPKWSTIQCTGFGITLMQHHLIDESGEDVIVYSSTIDMDLASDKVHQNSIMTEIHGLCPHCVARDTIKVALAFSTEFYPEIVVIAEDGTQLDALSIDDRLEAEALLGELHFENQEKTESHLLH